METNEVSDWWVRGGLPSPPGAKFEVVGRDPVLGARHHAGEAAAGSLALAGVWSAHIGELRGNAPQCVRVDVADAAASLLGFAYQEAEFMDLTRVANPLSRLYRTKDNRWIHLHGGFPPLASGLLKLLDCSVEEVSSAVAQWPASSLEDAIAEARLCGAMVRTRDEWESHPQGQALAELPVVSITKVGDAEPRHRSPSDRPLDGVRVADLTRVLAGPTCGRTLAGHGADVLRIGSSGLPSVEPFVVETGHGKRSAFVDLDTADGQTQLSELLTEADIFCQGYRPGSLANRGFDPQTLAEISPGVIYVSISCYGHRGPWATRAGWEQLAQSATGIAAAEGGESAPRLLPAAATDYTTGYLAAAGAMTALARQMTEGGSWLVEASLCQTSTWLQSAGAKLDPDQASGLGDVLTRRAGIASAWGHLQFLEPAEKMERTPARWNRPPPVLGSDALRWVRDRAG